MEFWLHVDIDVPVQVDQIPGGVFVVVVPALPGVFSENETLCGALKAAQDAIAAHVANTGGLDRGMRELPGMAAVPSDIGSIRATRNGF